MKSDIDLDRRRFIVASAAAGGGMALGFGVFAATDPNATRAKAEASAKEFTPWLVIAPDNIVTMRIPVTECGNGAITQLAMTMTEELECDWAKVRTEHASTQRDFTEGGVYSKAGPLTYFSGRSTGPEWMQLLLQMGASGRERLKLAAAREWNVPVSEIEASKSLLTHRPTGRTLSYGAVADRAALIKLDAEPKLKPQSEWTFLGKKSPAKLHGPSLVDGSAVYGIDVRLPGMLYAALLQSPVQGGKLKSYDFEKIKHMPGVRAVVVVDPSEPRKALNAPKPYIDGLDDAQSAIAVIADHYWQARTALGALPVEWDDGPGAMWKSTEQINDAAIALLDQPGKIGLAFGNADEVIEQQPKVVEAVYRTPYCEHAAMEPLNGTALVTPDRVDVWHPSQHSSQAHFVAAEETGMPLDKVFFHQTLIGGAFGRRVLGNDVRMVVAVARKYPGHPIHVIWSREETTRQGRYRALVATKLRAGLDASGMPEVLIGRAAGRGMTPRGIKPEEEPGFSVAYGLLYSAHTSGMIPNVRVEYHQMPLNIQAGPYRGPGYNSQTFFIESFIDECALVAGIDPLDYRLKLYARWPDPGATQCLKEAAQKSGWGKKLPHGMAQGIAIGNWGMNGRPQAGTTVCAVATVEVSKKGELKVHAIDMAFDCGRILNRDAVLTEIQGAVIFGLNMALNEALTVKDGRIVEGNFDQYPMVRMADMPAINVHFGGLSGHERFGEIGEAGVGVIGPAIGNAIFKITGKRFRSTPFRSHDLSWA